MRNHVSSRTSFSQTITLPDTNVVPEDPLQKLFGCGVKWPAATEEVSQMRIGTELPDNFGVSRKSLKDGWRQVGSRHTMLVESLESLVKVERREHDDLRASMQRGVHDHR